MAINLEKITLEKQGDSHKIDLTKRDASGASSTQEIVINLNWTQETQKKKGLFGGLFGGSSSVDLDLGCFFQLSDGQKSVIDGLQFSQGQGGPKNMLTRQGRYTGMPWIWHTGDERSGSGAGENILVNPLGLQDLQRIVVYCFIYEGVAKWEETNAIASIKVPGTPDIVVEMGKQFSHQKFCALADISFVSNQSITVKKLVTFHDGHADCDSAYNWGMKWTAGSK